MASRKRIGRRPRRRYTPDSRRGRVHQGPLPTNGTRYGGSGRHGEPLWAIEPEGSVRALRVPFTPTRGLADDDLKAMWELIHNYSYSIISAGRYAGLVFERDGVIYLQRDDLLHDFAERLAEWGKFSRTVEVDVPEKFA